MRGIREPHGNIGALFNQQWATQCARPLLGFGTFVRAREQWVGRGPRVNMWAVQPDDISYGGGSLSVDSFIYTSDWPGELPSGVRISGTAG
jgi:hypothetical protein